MEVRVLHDLDKTRKRASIMCHLQEDSQEQTVDDELSGFL